MKTNINVMCGTKSWTIFIYQIAYNQNRMKPHKNHRIDWNQMSWQWMGLCWLYTNTNTNTYSCNISKELEAN